MFNNVVLTVISSIPKLHAYVSSGLYILNNPHVVSFHRVSAIRPLLPGFAQYYVANSVVAKIITVFATATGEHNLQNEIKSAKLI